MLSGCRPLLLAIPALWTGCYASHGAAPDAGPDAAVAPGVDAAPPPRRDDAGPPPRDDAGSPRCDDGETLPATATVGVDLLLVVDSSDSMAGEQVLLAAAFPRVVAALVTGDVDADGRRDVPAVEDVHAGVVTADLGVGARTSFCEDPDGDDGLLRTTSTAARGCGDRYPPFLSYVGGDRDLETFAHDVGCVARVGIEGCRVEQPLEAALKALTPATGDLRFAFGSPTGHGDGANAGFLRGEAILAVLIVTDEDDCSFRDPELWLPSSERYEGNLRCRDYEGEALHDVGRFVDGLRSVKPDPERLVVAAVAGVPGDLVWDPGHTDYGAILRDPRMDKRTDPRYPDQLLPVCGRPDGAMAEPAVRIVRAVSQFGRHGVVQSICGASLDSPLRAVSWRIGDAVRAIGCGD